MGRLLLVLGDQLSTGLDLLREADPRQDTLLMAEVAEEAHQVVHHRQKLVMFFSAMRHFAARLAAQGWRVRYVRYRQGLASLPSPRHWRKSRQRRCGGPGPATSAWPGRWPPLANTCRCASSRTTVLSRRPGSLPAGPAAAASGGWSISTGSCAAIPAC